MKGNQYINLSKNHRVFFFLNNRLILHSKCFLQDISKVVSFKTSSYQREKFLVNIFHYFTHKSKNDAYPSIYAFKHISLCACVCIYGVYVYIQTNICIYMYGLSYSRKDLGWLIQRRTL